MSSEITRLQASDFEEALDMLNFSFGFQHPKNFETLLPALYKAEDEHMSWNWAIRENGRIRAIVGAFPLGWQLGETTLRISGIGGVSCHPRARNQGYMQQLMSHAVASMRSEGYHLSYLGGQRQRYGYYGYEKCGIFFYLSLSKNNLRHVFGIDPLPIKFRPLTREDQTHLQGAIGLHDAQPFRGLRAPERFYDLLLDWQHQPHIALSADGRMIGYLVANQSGDTITELLAVNEGEPELAIAAAWVQQHGDTRFELSPWNRLLPKLAHLCEGTSVSSSGNWLIFDWENVLDALLKTRAAQGPLVDGAVIIEIEGYGRLLLEVDGENIRCARTDAKPALSADPTTAMRLLLGPLPPSAVLALPAGAALLEQWCPLPLFWGRQDGV